MTLEQLRIFLAVAEREHVTEASRALGLTQSAVSHAVALLEGACGVALFSRIGRRIEITEAGRILRDEARDVLGRVAQLRERMADLAGLRVGSLALHASQTISGYWLPGRMVAFRSRYPGIDLTMTAANTAEVCRAVREGRAALGFIEGAPDAPDLQCDIVARDQLVLVVAPTHPWALSPPMTAKALVGSDWILREEGSGTRAALSELLAEAGLSLRDLSVGMTFASNEAVRSAVETGGGASILSASVVAGAVEAGLLCIVPYALPDRAFCLVTHPERDLGHAGRAFAAMLKGGESVDGKRN